MSELKKELSLYGLSMIAIGSCIGSGIFLTPALIATYLPNAWLIVLVWLVGGVITLTGALSFAELGSMFPQAGGAYIYLKEAYGGFLGFLYGWSYLTVTNTGAIAALSIAFATYVGFFFPLSSLGMTLVAVAVIITVTLVNLFRVKLSEYFANFFGALKLLGIAMVILIGIALGGLALNNWELNFQIIGQNFSGKFFGLALVGVLWSFGGWQHATFLSGEAKNASKNVPKAMIIGAVVVTIVYILANLGYLFLLPIEQMANSQSIAADAISSQVKIGGALVAILIAISVFGTAGIYTMSCPRIYYAMAKDGLFFKSLAKIHSRHKTPVNAILIQSALAIILLLVWGTFEEVITYVVFTDWIFFTLIALSVFIFRKRYPDRERPIKTWGYPLTPLIFVLITSAFVINTFIEKPTQAYAGLILLVVAYPVYYYFKNKKKSHDEY